MNHGAGRLHIHNVVLVPMDGDATKPLGDVRPASLTIEDGRITELSGQRSQHGDMPGFDGGGLHVLPGFVQGHVHYCQTLLRGMADDLPLMDWLQQRIWPLEAAHNQRSIRVSAQLSVAELLLGGTTAVQVMESVRHADEAFGVAEESGMRTILGNCLMDQGDPAGLVADTASTIRECEELADRFDGQGALSYAVSPRFVLSCSDELLRWAAEFANGRDLRIHTHACEHPDEVAEVRSTLECDNLIALHERGLLGPKTSLAHCVHTTPDERALLAETGTAVLHCPTTNLKLGSGIAPIAEYLAAGVRVGLGSDGAPCNNRLSSIDEMHTASLVAASRRPGALPAETVLRMATLGGAEALGLDSDLGSLERGKRADLVLLDLEGPFAGSGSPAARLVHAGSNAQVRHVFVGGRHVVRDGQLVDTDLHQIHNVAEDELHKLLARAGLSR